MHAKSLQLCLTLCDPMDYIAHQAPLSMGLSQQEYWSGLSCPPPGDLSNPGIEPKSSALHVDSLPPEPTGNPKSVNHCVVCAIDINSVALIHKCACYLS